MSTDRSRDRRHHRTGRTGRDVRTDRGSRRTGRTGTTRSGTGSINTGSINTGSINTGSLRTGSVRTSAPGTGPIGTGPIGTGSGRGTNAHQPQTWYRRLASWLAGSGPVGAALDTPLDASRRNRRSAPVDTERFGRASERFARFMGTASFLVGMTVFVGGWLAWNWLAPTRLQFDPRDLNFTLLTLLLSLQASYAAPLILLAQNRQADRDRVAAEQDRDRAERALADTEYLAREVAALRIALGEVATRDFVRSELRSLLEEYRDPREAGEKPRSKKSAKSGRSPKGTTRPAGSRPNGASGDRRPGTPGSADDGPPPQPHRSGSTDQAGVPTEGS